MQVKQRLRINVALSVIAAASVLLVIVLATYRVMRAVEVSDIAGEIITDAFERLTLRNDYVQTGNERVKLQWFDKHEEIGRHLASAAEIFRGTADQMILAEMIADQESIGRIFSGIVKNREKAKDAPHADALSMASEERLLTQLNTRINGLVLHAHRLQESSREALFSTLRLAGWGIALVLILVFTLVITNSWKMGRSITERIRRLRDGAATIGTGNLDHRIDVRGDDELAELSGAFDAMSAKLQSSYRDLENEIGERKRAQETTRRLNEDLTVKNIQLMSVNQELESFIYSVSHDLRQPLRAIASFSQIVKKGLHAGLREKESGYLTRIIDNATRMSDIIESMLKLSRISRQEIKPVEIDMTRMAEEVVSEIREAQPERRAEVVIEAGLTAVADKGLMAAVLENLIGNAWKFTARKENARIEFGAIERNGHTVYYVRDNGAGFDPEYAKNLFKPFHRLHSDSEFEGTGIGLSTVSRSISRHGGEVWAEGGIGKGATVFFTLLTHKTR